MSAIYYVELMEVPLVDAQMMQLLSDPEKAKGFAKVEFDLLKLAE
ncbi:MAG: hypothetical protein ACC700_20020 [Anaerolineales bacterium]